MEDDSTLAAEELLDPHPSEAAFHRVRSDIEAVPEAQLKHINLDILGTVTKTLGILPRIMALRAEIEEELKRFNLQRFDNLRNYTLALNHSHTRWRMAAAPKTEVTELAEQAEAKRDHLLADAQSLAGHGLVTQEPLTKCKTKPGYRPMASDILLLVNLIKGNWAKVENKTPVTRESLNEAATLAFELMAAVGEKDVSPPPVGEATRTRQQAYTLFREAYDDARRAVLFVRGEEEGDEIAPSLFAGRGGRPASATGQAVDATSTAQPPVNVDTQASDPAHAADSDAQNGGSSTQLHVTNTAGLPITNPIQN
jgi:hypothetical protein